MLGVGGKCFFDFFRYDNKAYAICDDGQQHNDDGDGGCGGGGVVVVVVMEANGKK